MKDIIDLKNEIQQADESNLILGENSESYALQAARYNRLSSLLEATADGLDGPEARDTF